MTHTISAAKAREEFARILEDVDHGKATYVVTKHKRQKVAIVPMEVLEMAEWALARFGDDPGLADARASLAGTRDHVEAITFAHEACVVRRVDERTYDEMLQAAKDSRATPALKRLMSTHGD